MDRRRFLKESTAAALYLGLGGFPSRQGTLELDLVIRGGTVLDGLGGAPVQTDIGVRAERIEALGRLGDVPARRVLDASGLHIAPGFIDVHTHSEDELLTNPKAESKIYQGVTTEILGQDGSSFDPNTFGDELRKLEEAGIAVNAGSAVGQGTIRGAVMGMSDRAANDSELERMRQLAATAFRRGALGISSGLEYTPGGFASTNELTELMKVMHGSSGLYATHMRNEDDRLLEAVEEAIAIAEGAGVGLHISHLKCQGQRNWEKVNDIFAAIDDAESRGVSITFDRYPYIAYATTLANMMPLWSREGGTERFIERLQDPEVWPRIREAMTDKVELLGSWDAVMVSSVTLEKNKELQGKTIAEIVIEKNEEDPYLYVRSFIIEEQSRVQVVGFGMGEETTARILAHPKCMPASDGSALADYGELRRGNPHPRSYGTFPRVLGKYVREMQIMSLEEAIRKMTSLPADRFGLKDRGRIAEGFYADIVVFDPANVRDTATFAEPHAYAEGMEAIAVNGELVMDGGKRTEALPGRVLRGNLRAAL